MAPTAEAAGWWCDVVLLYDDEPSERRLAVRRLSKALLREGVRTCLDLNATGKSAVDKVSNTTRGANSYAPVCACVHVLRVRHIYLVLADSRYAYAICVHS